MKTPASHPPHRLLLATLLLIIGLNGTYAGYGFVGTPDGSGVGIPIEWLEDSPFTDYLLPGVLLFSLGLLHLLAAGLQLLRTHRAAAITLVAGGGLIIWIVVQAIMMGSTRHPVQTILQLVCLTVGSLTVLLALRQLSTTSIFVDKWPR